MKICDCIYCKCILYPFGLKSFEKPLSINPKTCFRIHLSNGDYRVKYNPKTKKWRKL